MVNSLSLQIHHRAVLKALWAQSRVTREADGISGAQSVKLLTAWDPKSRNKDLSGFPPAFVETCLACPLMVCWSFSRVCSAAPCSWTAASMSPVAEAAAPSPWQMWILLWGLKACGRRGGKGSQFCESPKSVTRLQGWHLRMGQWVLSLNLAAVGKGQSLPVTSLTLQDLCLKHPERIWEWKRGKHKEGNIWWPHLSFEKCGNMQDWSVMHQEQQRPGNARQFSSWSKNWCKNGSWRCIHLWCCEQIIKPCHTGSQDS